MSYFGYEKLLEEPHNLIFIYSFSLKTDFSFPAFVTDFNDSFKSNWVPQEIYGKMDPVSTFKNTTRNISLSFDIPSSDLTMAKNNLTSLDTLIKGLYPIYNESGLGGIATIVAPPLFRIKFANYITNAATQDGLLGYLGGFDFKPEMSAGQFINEGIIYPKLLKASFNFSVLHEHPLGSKMQGGKPIPRITLKDGYTSYAYAHLFDTQTIAKKQPEIPKSPNVQTAGTELELYTARILQSGLTPAGKIGTISHISQDPFTTAEANKKEKYVSEGSSGGKLVLRNKETGEKVVLPISAGGVASVQYNNTESPISVL
jgi:hypothetical protein